MNNSPTNTPTSPSRRENDPASAGPFDSAVFDKVFGATPAPSEVVPNQPSAPDASPSANLAIPGSDVMALATARNTIQAAGSSPDDYTLPTANRLMQTVDDAAQDYINHAFTAMHGTVELQAFKKGLGQTGGEMLETAVNLYQSYVSGQMTLVELQQQLGATFRLMDFYDEIRSNYLRKDKIGSTATSAEVIAMATEELTGATQLAILGLLQQTKMAEQASDLAKAQKNVLVTLGTIPVAIEAAQEAELRLRRAEAGVEIAIMVARGRAEKWNALAQTGSQVVGRFIVGLTISPILAITEEAQRSMPKTSLASAIPGVGVVIGGGIGIAVGISTAGTLGGEALGLGLVGGMGGGMVGLALSQVIVHFRPDFLRTAEQRWGSFQVEQKLQEAQEAVELQKKATLSESAKSVVIDQ